MITADMFKYGIITANKNLYAVNCNDEFEKFKKAVREDYLLCLTLPSTCEINTECLTPACELIDNTVVITCETLTLDNAAIPIVPTCNFILERS